MAIGTRSYARGFLGSGALPPGIRWLLISNIAIFFIYFFAGHSFREDMDLLALRPSDVAHLYLWQLATYMFLHAGIGHILWNMLALWMFGRELEQLWGTRIFLRFYFFCGIGAGICVVVGNYLARQDTLTIGSSGAIYGILLATAVLWPDREMLFYFLIPIKMKYFVMIVGALAFLNSFNSNSGVSNVAHLGGMLFGYIFLKVPGMVGTKRRGPGMMESIQESYSAWKIARAKKKFQVYMKKQGSDRDRFVN